MATACAFFPLGKCLRASAKPPPRKKGALRQRWIANGDPCRYVLRADVATELGSPALAGGKICKCCYDALPEPTAAGKENAPPDFLQPGALDVQRLRGGAHRRQLVTRHHLRHSQPPVEATQPCELEALARAGWAPRRRLPRSAGLRTGYRPAGRRAGVCAAGWVAVRLGQSKLY